MRKILEIDQESIQLRLDLHIDEAKFTEELAEEINKFWHGWRYRLEQEGSHQNAALKLYAAEMFQQAAFNSFLRESYVTDKFNWSLQDTPVDGGIEGFPSLQDAGITILFIENLFIETDHITIRSK